MTTLSPSEASILSQLREKPMKELDFVDATGIITMVLEYHGLLRFKTYFQQWRQFGVMTICHLTHEGRMALIEYEKSQIKL